MAPRVRRPIGDPLDPGRVGDRRRQAGIAPDAIDGDFDPGDAAVRGPGDPRDRHLSRGHAAARRVDPGLGQDRAVLGPAERDPVAVERLERRQLQFLEPLGGRHVAEQPGNDEAGRVAVDPGQRLVVHLEGDHRLARRVHHPGRRHPGRPAVDRTPDELRRRGLDAGDVEHIAQPDARPLGVADQLAADLVADAGDGHVLLEHRERDELLPGQDRLAVDQAVDAQRPAGRGHARGEERRCRSGRTGRSGTTIGVKAADRRGQVRLGRERRDGDRGRWHGRSVADRRGPSALEQVPADDPGGDRRRRRRRRRG